MNGKTDLTRAEAIQEIIAAKTDTSRQKAAGRLAGSLYRELTDVRALLLSTLAALEAEIEYPEDEHSLAAQFDDADLRTAVQKLESLCESWASEKLYQEGARAVLCGRTNAGKSSLFNMLLKEERSIVSEIHGTTRDWIESAASFDGIPVTLYDTAGIRDSGDAIEKEGVERAKSLLDRADAVIYVVDGTRGIAPDDKAFLDDYPREHNAPLVIAFNKSDLAESESGAIDSAFPGVQKIPVSAKTGKGIPELVASVKSALMPRSASHAIGLGSARQKKICEDALDSARHALHAAQKGFTLDAVAADIEDALYFLGEITGEVTTDEILDTVFSRFCLGK
jgi:tRNA modification GTPase